MVTWIEILPAVTGVCYAAAAVAYYNRGEYWNSLMFGAYALANVGLIGTIVSAR